MKRRAPENQPSGGGEDRELLEIQSLLLGDTTARLQELEGREEVVVDAEQIAEYLPDAILRREARDDRVERALSDTIEAGLFRSARQDPQALADAIHPALGPAIRSMIQASLRQSLEKLNVALENAFSPQGLRWRLQAARTGQSFSEVVLLNTLLFRVEQVMLVHRESGLVLAEASGAEAPNRDADLVAAMLSAIRDFGADSMGAGSADGPLEIEFEERTMILAPGPAAVLALVVRGNPPRDLHENAREAVEELHVEYGEEFFQFDGDSEALAGVPPFLEDLLVSEERQRPKSTALRTIPILVAAALVVFLGWRAVVKAREVQDVGAVKSALADTPGLVVTDVRMRDGAIRVEGLQDPLLRSTEALAKASLGARQRKVSLALRPYVSLDPALVVRRARRVLPIPKGAALTLEGTWLRVEGVAPDGVLAERIRERAPLLPGIETVAILP